MALEECEGPHPQLELGKTIVQTVSVTFLVAGIALFNNVVIARLGGPVGRGRYAVAVSLVAVAWPLVGLGLGAAGSVWGGKGAGVGGVTRLIWRWHIGLICCSLGIAIIALRHVGGASGIMVAAVALAVPASSFCEATRGVLLGTGRTRGFNGVQLVAALGLLVGSALFGASHAWIPWSLALGYAAAACVSAVLLRSIKTGPIERLSEIVRFGLSTAVVAETDFVMLWGEYLVVAFFVSPRAIGIYAVGDQISHLLAWAGLIAAQVLRVDSARSETSAKSGETLRQTIRLFGIWVIVGGLAFVVIGRQVIVVLFGGAFAPSYAVAVILFAGSWAKGAASMISTWLQAQGSEVDTARLTAGFAVAHLVLTSSGLALGGIYVGAAVKASLYVATTFGLLALARRRHTIPITARSLFPRRSDVSFLRSWVARATAR